MDSIQHTLYSAGRHYRKANILRENTILFTIFSLETTAKKKSVLFSTRTKLENFVEKRKTE